MNDKHILEVLTAGLDLDDWDDHHRAQEIVDALRAAGYDIAPTDTIDLGNVLRKVGSTPDLGGGFDEVINGLFAAAAVDR